MVDGESGFLHNLGRFQSFVTVRCFAAMATCYAESNARVRPRADMAGSSTSHQRILIKLLDAIFLSAQMPENSVICAREPFHQNSEAMIVQFGEDFSIPWEVTQDGYVYFLETDGVTELLEMISQKRSSRETKVEFVCYYASCDAYPAFYNDLGDVAALSR